MLCSSVASDQILCDDCAAIEVDLRKVAIKRAEFCNPVEEFGRCTDH